MDTAANCVGCGRRYTWLDDSGLCYICKNQAGGVQISVSSDQKFYNCRVCGTDLRNKRADAQFCSDGCRQKFHRAMNAGHDKWCEMCGDSFKAKRADAETCSPKCRQSLYRLRKGKQSAAPVVLGYDVPVIRVYED